MNSNTSENIFVGDSEMALLMRSLDWSQTPLGPVSGWAQSLKTSISILMSSRYPMFVWWGREYANLYNDAYRPMMGAKHPQFLGQSAKDCWAGIWDVVGPLADNVMTTGQSTWSENLLLIMDRNGYPEEAYFTFSYSPVRDESGGVAGLFCAVIETTKQFIGERRLRSLRELSSSTVEAKTVEQACQLAIATLSANTHDVPFALLYLVESNGDRARLASTTTNIQPGTIASPEQVDLTQKNDLWNLSRVNQTKETELVEDLTVRYGELPGGAWSESPHTALVMPVTKSGQAQHLAGFLVVGVSPQQALDDEYRGFFDLVATHVTTAIANAEAYEAERKRAEALAELDRAKTLFFSNVSHEFRTPLTLMLNPLEDILANPSGPNQCDRKQLEIVYRNSQRLLKLVNTLLDFSRIESGRIEAVYEPTDLAMLTADLAGVFRSAIERAGISLQVNCPPLPQLVYVDREMWEKIVLNLLSNAFKFTFAGEIAISLKWCEGENKNVGCVSANVTHRSTIPSSPQVILEVRDTGTGIPSEDLPHIFERFHRAKGSRGRSYEGSGIGLSLVQELETILSSISDGFYTLDRDWRFTYVNDRLCEMAGKQREELLDYSHWELFPDAVGTEVDVQFHRAVNEQTPLQFEYLYLPWNRWFEYRVYPSPNGLTIFVVEVTERQAALRERKQAELVLVEQKKLLELIALGHPLDECLSALCTSLSRLNPRIRAGILLTDAQGLTFPRSITPDFSPSFGQGLKDAPINELCIGTCGEAVYSGQPVTCADIANDDRWSREWRELCIAHGILGCHSAPILGIARHPLGSLMLCFDEARMPTDWEYQLAYFGTQVASIALERDRSSAEIQTLNQTLAHRVDELEALFDLLPIGVAIAEDPECRMIRSNPYLSRIIRVPVDANHSHSVPPDERPAYRVRQEGQELPVEELPMQYAAIHNTEVRDKVVDIVHPDGTVITLLCYASPLHDAQGKVRGALGGFADITDLKQAEAALRESEQQFRLFVTASSDLMYKMNTDWSEMRYLKGKDFLASTENPSRTWLETYIPPEDQPQVLASIQEAIRTKSIFELEHRVIRLDGTVGWAFSRAIPLLDAENEIIEWFGTASDVTERQAALRKRKQAESALRQSEERYRYLVEATPQLVWAADAQGHNTYISQQMCDYIGLPSDQLLDLNWQTVIHPDDVERISLSWMESVQNGIPYEAEYRLQRSDGTYRWQLVRAMPLRDEQGKIMQWFGVSTDIHDKQELEQQRSYLLQQAQTAREEAERANRIKDEFLAVLSHELRSPLNPILGWSNLLQNRKLDEATTKQALATIERNARLQSELIEDLLDVSRILRGKLSLTISSINLTSIIQAAIETVRLAAEAKSIQIETKLDPFGGLVSGDLTRLQQVVWNLLSNAVKFTPPQGKVEVQLEQINDYAQITVTDTGKGIHPDFLPFVFDYFRQEDSATTRKFGGLGLGLAIVRHLVELHGGTVKADSPGDGLGATFTVRLPLMPSQPTSNIDRLSELSLDLQGIQILVVDDDTDTLDFVTFVLEQAGARVIAVSSASEAIATLTQAIPDFLLSDIGMPEMDGYMLMQQIRALPPERGGQIKAIALTAYAGDLNQQQALQAGFQRHLAKPIDLQVLIKTISELKDNS